MKYYTKEKVIGKIKRGERLSWLEQVVLLNIPEDEIEDAISEEE